MTAEQKRREDYKSGTGAPALPRGRAPRKDNAQLSAKVKMSARVVTRGNKGRIAAPADPTRVHDKPSCGRLDSQKLLASRPRPEMPARMPARMPGTVLDVSGWPAEEQARAKRWLELAETISQNIA